MRFRYLILFCLLAPGLLPAQSFWSRPVSLSVTNHATLLPPASIIAVFNQPIHPGFNAAYEFSWSEKEYRKWFQDVSLGYYHHRYAFDALMLGTKAGYRRSLGHLSVQASLYAGYMHMFLLTDRLVKQEDGSYAAKKGFGKPQFMTGLGVGMGYHTGTIGRVFLDYDFRLQMPFVKSYVPLLPSGILSLGYQLKLQ